MEPAFVIALVFLIISWCWAAFVEKNSGSSVLALWAIASALILPAFL